MAKSFYAVVTEAVADLSEHGFDSVERVEKWLKAIRSAAERSMISPGQLEKTLKGELRAVYHRLVELGEIYKHHDVGRFTVAQLKPKLRAELDRRIMASANLIKLNRSAAIEKTLQRFSGWATSIPKGGSRAVDRVETKIEVRKALAQLPFEERRVLIDQGHKLTASLSDIIANDNNAIAGRWSSHWRQPGYNFREDHKERDGEYYLIRDSWAHKRGLVKPSHVGFTDAVTQPAEEIFCRCRYIYLYALRDLPDNMLTAKGKKELERVAIAV